MTRSGWRSGVLTTALVGGAISVLMTVLVGSGAATGGGWLFVIGVTLWAAMPYLTVALICRLVKAPAVRSSCAIGLLAYAVVDVVLRFKALFLPSGSTDSLLVLFLPIFAPFVIASVAALAMLVAWWRGR